MVSSKARVGLLFSFLVWAGCAKPPPSGGTEGDVNALIQKGWASFEQSLYDSAYLYFFEATSIDPQSSEAWTGLGWSALVLYDLALAHDAFVEATTLTPDSLAPWAGLAIGDSDPLPDPNIYRISIDSVLALSIYAANRVLQQNPNYQFSHDPRVTATLLQLVKARALCAAHRFYEALQTVQALDPNFDVDVSTPEGRSQLIAYIAGLISQITGGWF